MEGLIFTAYVNAGAACIKIVQDSGGAVVNVVVQAICNYNGWTDTIDDTMNNFLR
jgi:hypothetical protein